MPAATPRSSSTSPIAPVSQILLGNCMEKPLLTGAQSVLTYEGSKVRVIISDGNPSNKPFIFTAPRVINSGDKWLFDYANGHLPEKLNVLQQPVEQQHGLLLIQARGPAEEPQPPIFPKRFETYESVAELLFQQLSEQTQFDNPLYSWVVAIDPNTIYGAMHAVLSGKSLRIMRSNAN